MENQFNDSQKFDKELVEVLSSLLEAEIKSMLEYVIATHNIKPLIALRKMLKQNKF